MTTERHYHPGCHSSHKTQKAMLNCDKGFGTLHLTNAEPYSGDPIVPLCGAPNRRKDQLWFRTSAYIASRWDNPCKVCFKDES